MPHGKLIVLEGLDGSGKFTQSKILFDKMKSDGKKVKLISMPNYKSNSSGPVRMYLNGEISTNLYDINAFASSSFFAVDRFIDYFVSWKKFYEDEDFNIICDRYSTSNMIFQLAKLKEYEWDTFLDWICDYEYGKLGLPSPDLVIYLRVTPELSYKLVKLRSSYSDLHENNLVFLKKCYEAAEYVSRKFNWKVINCSEKGIEMDSIDQISGKIFEVLETN